MLLQHKENTDRKFYVYAYLRSKDSKNGKIGTPYYIGKGCGNRAYRNTKRKINVPENTDNIIFLGYGLSENQAFDAEKHFIRCYGRLDNGTGILHNFTDGGEGTSGTIISPEIRAKYSGKNHPMYGKKHTEEARKKISRAIAGRKLSVETIEKIIKSNTGKKRTSETKANISAAKIGKKLTLEHRRKMSIARKGKKMSPEAAAKSARSRTGLKHTDEAKAKMSANRKGRKLSAEHKAKLSKANLGRKLTPEHKAKLLAANLGRKFSDESKTKMHESALKRWKKLKVFQETGGKVEDFPIVEETWQLNV